jgi:hypothetical protein
MRQMIGWALEPADDDMLLFLIAKGKKDAHAWAESHGVGTQAKAAAAGSSLYLLGMN